MICDDTPHCVEDEPVLDSSDLPQPPVANTTEIRDKIISMLREKRTSGEIARELGIPRNAVAGVKFRYNAKNPNDKIGRVKDIAGFKPGPAPRNKPRLVMWRGKPRIKPPMDLATNGHVPKGSKPIYKLKENECKYATTPHGTPPDKHRFCGHPTLENSPYCVEHHKLCRETVNDRKGKSKSDPARGAVRLPSRLHWHY